MQREPAIADFEISMPMISATEQHLDALRKSMIRDWLLIGASRRSLALGAA
jgi:hypothetical protein